jgi:beta-glucosidase
MEEGAITLLRDQDGILPLNPARTKSIAVIGKVANSFITGGGSSNVTPYSSVSLLSGIQQRAAAAGVRVAYNNGSNVSNAVALARASSVAVVVAANYETEGADLQCLTLGCPTAYGNQDALISAVAAANPNTIVLLEAGGPVLTPWQTQVKGLLDAWYPGESGGSAIAQVLFGDIDPSGHLPLTFPGAESQEPTYGDPSSYPGIGIDETHREGAFVGYRWFDAHGLTPAYPFGFGLSYTSFRYSGLRITRLEAGARVSFTVINVGSRAGSVLPQLYLGLSSLPGIPEPPAQLEGFAKVPLAPGQQTRVRFVVGSRALSCTGMSAPAPGALPRDAPA